MAQANVDATKKINSKLSISYGADWNLNLISSQAFHYAANDRNNTWDAQTRYADGSRWMSTAAFANALFNITPNFSLSGGTRMNHIYMFTPIRFNGFEKDAVWNFIAPSGALEIGRASCRERV